MAKLAWAPQRHVIDTGPALLDERQRFGVRHHRHILLAHEGLVVSHVNPGTGTLAKQHLVPTVVPGIDTKVIALEKLAAQVPLLVVATLGDQVQPGQQEALPHARRSVAALQPGPERGVEFADRAIRSQRQKFVGIEAVDVIVQLGVDEHRQRSIDIERFAPAEMPATLQFDEIDFQRGEVGPQLVGALTQEVMLQIADDDKTLKSQPRVMQQGRPDDIALATHHRQGGKTDVRRGAGIRAL
ncbi:hypothetical protein CUR86_11080 [Salinicola acroporae]|uniref:Uncharacterized protein n=1 Tax=Salinicola acroporae TaxID=1541440 RepID=A0ABT6I5M4_9GAMM|nr:hypothetical protein [Salinicola acroporae]